MNSANERAFDFMTATADKTAVSFEYPSASSLDKEYTEKARRIRTTKDGREMKYNYVEEKKEFGDYGYGIYSYDRESSHRMRHKKLKDGNWVVFPSIFPKNKNPSTAYEDWEGILDDDVDAAFSKALAKDEVFYFGKNEDEAVRFAKGSWKPKKSKGDY